MSKTLQNKMAEDLVRQFELLAPLKSKARKTGKGDFKGWQQLAVETAAYLKERYPDESIDPTEQTFTGALNEAKRIKAALRSFDKNLLMDQANYYPVQTIASHFAEALTFLFAEYQQRINTQYKERVAIRSTDEARIEVSIGKWLDKAKSVLVAATTGDDVKWLDVSCALALVTGRRMSEIHFSATFKPASEYEVYFTGQLKGKSRKVEGEKLINHEFTIPTLVEADLVCKALAWLDSQGKRLGKDEKPETVNKRWAKELSKQAKAEWCIIPDVKWQDVDPKDKWTYHKFRGLYFVTCLSKLEQTRSFSSIKRLAPQILGDADISVIEPYERFDVV